MANATGEMPFRAVPLVMEQPANAILWEKPALYKQCPQYWNTTLSIIFNPRRQNRHEFQAAQSPKCRIADKPCRHGTPVP
jgi:hypothetical protein